MGGSEGENEDRKYGNEVRMRKKDVDEEGNKEIMKEMRKRK